MDDGYPMQHGERHSRGLTRHGADEAGRAGGEGVGLHGDSPAMADTESAAWRTEPVAQEHDTSLSDTVAFVFRAAWRSRWICLVIFALGTFAGVFAGAIHPNTFESIGKLLVRPGVRESVTPETAVAGGQARPGSLRESLANEMQILQSPRLMQLVAEAVGPQTILEPYDPAADDDQSTPIQVRLLHELQAWWFSDSSGGGSGSESASPLDAAQHALESSLAIFPEPDSSVLTVSCVATSPRLAHMIVDAALEAVFDLHREVFETSSSLAFLREEWDTVEREASEAARALHEYEQENRIFDMKAQRDALFKHIGELETGLIADRVEFESLQARKGLLQELYDKAPAQRTVGKTKQVFANPE